jgi:archaeal flagellin FlaB
MMKKLRYKLHKRFGKRAAVGIEMLLIFIASVLISAIAAGVLIQATGTLQQNALTVSSATQDRLVTGLDVVSVVGIANVSEELLVGVEIQTRLRAGSPAIQLQFTKISVVWRDASFALDYNVSLQGQACQFEDITGDSYTFCAFNMIGDNNSILAEGEILALRFMMPTGSDLGVIEEFELGLQPRSGALTVLQLRTPELMLTPRVRLR